MKFIKLFTLSIFVSGSLFLLNPFSVYGATGPVTLATVNIVNSKIVSQKNNTFDISFSLTNRTGVQSGVKYGVELIGVDANDKQFTADQNIYSSLITLTEGSNIPQAIIYEAPKILSGKYELFLVSRNESGLTLARTPLGEVTLKPSTGILGISPSSCFIQVVGEKNLPHYSTLQGVSITKDEKISLTCNVLNSTAKTLTVKPIFDTLYRTAYGAKVPQVGGSSQTITINSNQNKSFSVTLPTTTIPQLYNVSVKLSDGKTTSNTINTSYLLNGPTASILDLSLNKDSYKKGDSAMLSLVYMSPDNNSQDKNARITNTNLLSNFVFKATILNDKKEECISPIEKKLTQDVSNPKVEISANVKKDCFNPKITATLLDNKGNKLDQKEILINSNTFSSPASTSVPTQKVNLLKIMLLIGALVVIGGALYFINLKKKSNETNPQ